jgi:hypothetical protein
VFCRHPPSESRLGPRAPALVGELTWAGLDDVCVLVHGGAAVTATLALGGPPGGLVVAGQGPWSGLLAHLGEHSARVYRLTHLVRVVAGEPHAYVTLRVRAPRGAVDPQPVAQALVEDATALVIPFLERAGFQAQPLDVYAVASLVAHAFCPSRPLSADVTPASVWPRQVDAIGTALHVDEWWHATAAVRTRADAALDDVLTGAAAALDMGAVSLSAVVPFGDVEGEAMTAAVTVSAESDRELTMTRARLQPWLAGWAWPPDQASAFAAAALPFAQYAKFVGAALFDELPIPGTAPPAPASSLTEIPAAAPGAAVNAEDHVPSAPTEATSAGLAELLDRAAPAPPPRSERGDRVWLRSPQPDRFTPPPREQWLQQWTGPLVRQGQQPGWFWLGVHGGAGVSTLAAAGAGFDADRLWPAPECEATPTVVAVARTHLHGLLAARTVATQFLAGCAPAGTVLLGLVTVADAPGELPPPLAAMRRELDELYAQVWTVPHLPLLRLHGGGPVSGVPELDTVVAQILSAALDHLNAAQEDSP